VIAQRDNADGAGIATGGRMRRIAATVSILCSIVLSADGFARQVSEYQVKAAFLLNFAKFIQWPASAFSDANSPFTICTLGKDPFGSALDEIVQGESVMGRAVAVRRFSQPPPARTCQVVFFEADFKEQSKALASLGQGTLTVGEGGEFIRDGGMIAFVIEERRVRFLISPVPAQRAGLTISSRLLGVALSVVR